MNIEKRLQLAKELLAVLEKDDDQDLIITMLKQRLKCVLVLDENKKHAQEHDREAIQFIY